MIGRLFKGSARKYFAVLVAGIFILSTYHLTSDTTPLTDASSIIACPPSWQSQSNHSTLQTPDPAFTSELWANLQDLFDNHAPRPASIEREQWPGNGDVTWDIIKSTHQIPENLANETRQIHADLVSNLPDYPLNRYSGRGIIMLAGGKYSEYAATSLNVLRGLGSVLPVELWMADVKEEKAGWCAELLADGVACHKLSDYMDVSVLVHGYQFKAIAMLFSSFAEFILVDADNVPLQNLDVLFDSEGYSSTGAVLWPDYWAVTASPVLPFITGVSDEPSKVRNGNITVESGQIVWSKVRHWKSLCLAVYYNYYGPQYYYTLISGAQAGWGDKDTFPTALQSLYESYHKVNHGVKTVFVNGTLQGIAILQANPAGEEKFEAMFLHANIHKWSITDFLCVGCFPSEDGLRGKLENKDSSIHPHLKEGRRILAQEEMLKAGIDAEPLIWKAMETTACRGVWSEAGLCLRTRAHMTKAFGFQFEMSKYGTRLGLGGRECATTV